MEKINEYQVDGMAQMKNDLITHFMSKEKVTYEEAEKMYNDFIYSPMTESMIECLDNIEKECRELENMSDEEIIKLYKERHP